MDISMPLMDGYETSRLIRENQLSAAPVVLLSANAFADDRERAGASGCAGYLAKPLQVNLLLDKLAQLLALEWIASEPTTTPSPARAETSAATSDAIQLALPEGVLQRIREHLDVGYVQGVVEQLDEARRVHPALSAQIETLRALAERFQLRELENELVHLPRATGA